VIRTRKNEERLDKALSRLLVCGDSQSVHFGLNTYREFIAATHNIRVASTLFMN
jgi:hypothetical protein